MLLAYLREQFPEPAATTDPDGPHTFGPDPKMDPKKNIDEVVDTFDGEGDEVSVDDFIKQLEEKEKDLHITVETSILEIAESFDDVNSEFEITIPREPLPDMHPPADPPQIDESGATKRLETEIRDLRAAISKMEADREEIFKNSQRRTKDFEAFKARSERERKETFQNQIGNVATLMLPALDNLHRALESAEHLPGEKSDSFQQFYEGIALVSEQINDILSKMGIRPIPTVGEEFNPHVHEAIATDDSGEYPQNTITGEILRGYIAGDRVIRHSMVKVAIGAARPAEDSLPTSDPVDQPDPELP